MFICLPGCLLKMLLSKCWAPCFTVKQSNFVTLNRGCILIALYTAFVHFFSFTYAIALTTESVRTDVFYSPFFELTQSKTRSWSIVLAIYSALYIICCSFSLIHGIRSVSSYIFPSPSPCVSLFFASSHQMTACIN